MNVANDSQATRSVATEPSEAPVRRAATGSAAPVCSTHKIPMVKRTSPLMSAEQRWCGEWWDCPKCTSSVLFPRRELIEQNARMKARQSVSDQATARRKP